MASSTVPAADGTATILPFDFLDRIFFAAQNIDRNVTVTPVWELTLRGDYREPIARQAIGALCRRYPVLASRVVNLTGDRQSARTGRLAYLPDSEPDLNLLSRDLDLRASPDAELRSLRDALFNGHLDLEEDYPVRFTWARTSSQGGTLFVQHHHAIADARSFLDLLTEFCQLYGRIERGELSEEPAAVPRVAEACMAEPRRWRRFLDRQLGYWLVLRSLIQRAALRNQPLYSNLNRDYSGRARLAQTCVGAEQVARIGAITAATRYSTNDLLTTAMAAALFRWSEASAARPKRFTVLIPVDTRPRGRREASFGNYLSFFAVVVPQHLARCPGDLLHSVHRQLRRQRRSRRHVKVLLAGMKMVRFLSTDGLRRLLRGDGLRRVNFLFSNFAAFRAAGDEERFATATWQAESLGIKNSCPYGHGVLVSVSRYAGELCFNFNFVDSCLTPASIDDLRGVLLETLDQLLEQVGERIATDRQQLS